MSTATKVRWGIWSTGRMAEWFTTDFAQVEGGELVAVGSRTASKAQAFARRFGIPKAHAGLQSLLDDPSVDVVYLATPHSLHHAEATAALRAGKAVLCEKPLTVTPEETESLIAVAKETGGYLMEALWTYFLPAIHTARQWVEAGRIGRLQQVQVDFGYPVAYHPKQREYDATLGGGALLEMGIYPVALVWLFLGRAPTSVQVQGRRAPNGVEDDVVAVYDFDHGAGPIATLGTSFRCKLPNRAFLIGDEGTVCIPDFWRARGCELHVLDEKVDQFQDARDHQGFCFEAEAVCRDLRAGRRESEVVPWATSLELQRQIAAIRRLVPSQSTQ